MEESKEQSKADGQAMWQTLVLSQLAQVESMLQRVDATLKSQLTKSKDQLDEMNKLTASAMTWAAGLQKGAMDLTLATLKSATDAIQKVRA